MKKLACLLLAAVLILGLGGCSLLGGRTQKAEEDGQPSPSPSPTPAGSSVGQELAETYKADRIFSLNAMEGQSFNPYATSSAWNLVVSMLAYEPLVNTDNTFEAQPNLVTEWSTEDGYTWTFTVDTTRKFHDGGVMTPSDAVYSIDLARNQYNGRYSKRFVHVQSVYGIDESHFIVTLDQSNWRFYELLNIPCVELNTGYNSIPVGTGPYKFNSSLTALTLDPNYPGAKDMDLKTIRLKHYTNPEDILQAFEDSLLDLVVNNPSDMSSLGYSSSNIIKYVETSNLHFIGYNMQSRIFAQPAVRAAVTYAIDRDTIVASSMQGAGTAATLPIHPNSSLYPRSLARSLAYSKDFLTTALGTAGASDTDFDGVIELGGIRAEVTFLVCSDSVTKVSVARQIGNQLRDAGFLVNMKELNYSEYLAALRAGEYDLYYGEVKLCNDWDLTELLGMNGSLNYGGYRDQNMGGYIASYLGSGPDQAALGAETLCQYLAQAAPITAVCFERTQVLYHRGVLSTINPTQENIFNDIRNWTVDLD